MNFFVNFFNTIFYRPLFNILVLLYLYLPGHDFGIAIIVLTFLIKIIFYPLGNKTLSSQSALQSLQPKLQEIQQKYKDNKEKLIQETLDLYKKEKFNPFSGCLAFLIQFPVLIALYQVFWQGLEQEKMQLLYSFIPRPEKINPMFLGQINLSQPNLYLIIFAGIAQFFQLKMPLVKNQVKKFNQNKKSFFEYSPSKLLEGILEKQMLYFFPIFTVLILWKLPSAIALYWLVSSIFSIIQQYIFLKNLNKNLNTQN